MNNFKHSNHLVHLKEHIFFTSFAELDNQARLLGHSIFALTDSEAHKK